MLDVERADRISRLAGMERVMAARPMQSSNLNPTSASTHPPGYFDTSPGAVKDRSTVGSASATESVGGRTTWASGSVDMDGDKMSEDQDDGRSSTGGMSDENLSLVGFGEAAGSTASVPISTPTSRAAAVAAAAATAAAGGRVATPMLDVFQSGGIGAPHTTTTPEMAADVPDSSAMSVDVEAERAQ